MAGVVRLLDPHIDVWLIAAIDAPRGASTAELAQALQDASVRGEVVCLEDVPAAVRFAYNAAGENDRIAAFGSFYTVAAVMQERDLHVI